MIIEIASALTPRPIVIDTDAPKSDGAALAVLKPSVRVRASPEGAVLASYTPNGDPEGSLLPFVLMAAGILIVTFAVVGVAKSL